MPVNACPSAVVAAPVEVVWGLLADPEKYGWMGVRVVGVNPAGRARPGQTITLRGGLSMTGTVLEVNEGRQIAFRLNLPLGMVVESHISCVALDPSSCRVQYG